MGTLSINPKISVIIPTKNAGSYLLDCLYSIQNQTYANIEIIIADSLSSDNTIEIIKSNNFMISHYFSEPDSGIYDGMNKAISYANGEWLIFLGADDRIYAKDSIEIIVNNLKNLTNYDDIQLVICDGKCRGKLLKNSFNWKIIKGNSINHQCVLYNRKIFNNFSYDISYKYGADYKLNLNLYLRKLCFIKVNKILSVYNEFGVTSKYINDCLLEEKRVRRELLPLPFSVIINFLFDVKVILKRFKFSAL